MMKIDIIFLVCDLLKMYTLQVVINVCRFRAKCQSLLKGAIKK